MSNLSPEEIKQFEMRQKIHTQQLELMAKLTEDTLKISIRNPYVDLVVGISFALIFIAVGKYLL
ncbi:hypothetical protein [Alkalimarinus coralli]|uniref:hypothetical protein n=1 Tax=Alkalimarinus coralli TaxID=2935863 RepID=UPI00202AF182|nr:hypothetical protein [Alkalimarinus coralli]